MKVAFQERTRSRSGFLKWSPLVVVLLTSVLVSCGDGSTTSTSAPTTSAPDTSVATTTIPDTSGETTSTTAGETTPVTNDSPFLRRDTPPGGVAAQLELYVGGEGEGCAVIEADLPYLAFALTLPPSPSFDLTIGVPYALCVDGFELDVPIRLEITGPDGARHLWDITKVSTGEPEPIGDLLAAGSEVPEQASIRFSTKWTPEPGATPGDYTMSARQGDLIAESRFTLVPATIAKITTLTGRINSSTGGTHRVALTGFDPSSDVQVYLYLEQLSTGSRVFVTEVGPVPVDDRGEALLELDVEVGAPPGAYCLVTREMLDDLPEEVEFGFEYLADPCWDAGATADAPTDLLFVDP